MEMFVISSIRFQKVDLRKIALKWEKQKFQKSIIYLSQWRKTNKSEFQSLVYYMNLFACPAVSHAVDKIK